MGSSLFTVQRHTTELTGDAMFSEVARMWNMNGGGAIKCVGNREAEELPRAGRVSPRPETHEF